MKQKMDYLVKGLQISETLKGKREERKAQLLFSCHSSRVLDSAQLLPLSANLLTPPVTTWFSFTGDSFSLGRLWKAIKKLNCFWVTTSSSPQGLNKDFSFASVRAEAQPQRLFHQ